MVDMREGPAEGCSRYASRDQSKSRFWRPSDTFERVVSRAMTNVYTAEEISRHNRANDLWMVLNQNVYDLTYFILEHPGGEDVLLESAGKDGTECFDGIGHSVEAMLMRERFKIGQLAKGASMSAIEAISAEVPERVPSETPSIQDEDWQYEEPKKNQSHGLLSIGVVGIIIYILLFYYLWVR